jgi:hypothetical protein
MVGLAAIGSARADVFILDANFSSGGQVGPGPYGTVTLTQDGDCVDVAVSLNSPFAFNGGGAGFALGFDLSGHPDNVTITDITANHDTAHFVALLDPPNGLHADGTGNWDYAVDYTASGLSAVPHPTTLSFTVCRTGGAVVTIADFVNNPSGLMFISDIGNTTTGKTGDVAVPEPTTMIAGALLLLPFGASTLRVLRNRKA